VISKRCGSTSRPGVAAYQKLVSTPGLAAIVVLDRELCRFLNCPVPQPQPTMINFPQIAVTRRAGLEHNRRVANPWKCRLGLHDWEVREKKPLITTSVSAV
jgi:hypothetical protein